MADVILINAYSRATADKIRELLHKYIQSTWLTEFESEVFQICDELIKNAVKSNYRFALEWMTSRAKMLKEDPALSEAEADERLFKIFFHHDSDELERFMENSVLRKDQIKTRVRDLLNLENAYADYKTQIASAEESGDLDRNREILPLLKVKKLTRNLKINIHFHIEETPEELILMISNDSPMIEEDFRRVQHVRETFARYKDEDREMEFFTENIDLDGGGHGLGYAIMDAILYQMGLDPESSLYVVAATRTLILLVLPFDPASSPLRIRETISTES